MTSNTVISLPSRWLAADRNALCVRIDAVFASIPPSLLNKAREDAIAHLRSKKLPEHVRLVNGRYYWRVRVIGLDGRKQKINRILGRDLDEDTLEQYHYLEAELRTARRKNNYQPLFAALDADKDARRAETIAVAKQEKDAKTLRELWAAAGYRFTRRGVSMETTLTVWGGLTIAELVPSVIYDGICRMEVGDFTRPVRSGGTRKEVKARPLSPKSIYDYVAEFRRAMEALRLEDPTLPDLFAAFDLDLKKRRKKLKQIIHADRDDRAGITQRTTTKHYLDWATVRLPFIAAVLTSSKTSAHDLAALLLAMSFTLQRPEALACLQWSAKKGTNYVDGGVLVLYLTKGVRGKCSTTPERVEIGLQMRELLAVQRQRTGGKGGVFPALPADPCRVINDFARASGQYDQIRAYYLKHSAITDLCLNPAFSRTQISAEVNITEEVIGGNYALAKGVTARHFRAGQGETALSQLWYAGLTLNASRGTISVAMTGKGTIK